MKIIIIISILTSFLFANNENIDIFNVLNKNFYSIKKNNQNIIEYYIKDTKPYYYGNNNIYVKKDNKLKGKYIWNGYNYINNKNNEILIFKKNTKYIITILNNNTNYLKLNVDENSSENKIKKIIETYNKTSISYDEYMFIGNYLNDLKINKLIKLKNNEFLFIVNKFTQNAYIYIYKNNNFKYIVADNISTGNSKNTNYKKNNIFFETPIGIINRKKFYKGDWYSDGKNLGYGDSGNKIFWLGEYKIKINDNAKKKREFHFAIHSTNPTKINKLGNRASQGCIRISDELNIILNKSKILDGKRGKYVIILDSSKSINYNIKRTSSFNKLKSY